MILDFAPPEPGMKKIGILYCDTLSPTLSLAPILFMKYDFILGIDFVVEDD